MKSTRLIMAAVAATFLSTAAFAAPPTADQVSVPQGETMSRHHARMMALFDSPNQFMMFRMQMREATHGMSRDQKRAYRRSQMQKIKAMNAGEHAAWLNSLQAKWNALPNERKEHMEARMENKQGRHHGRWNAGQNGGSGPNAAPNAGQAPYDQSDDESDDNASAPPRTLQH